MNDNNKSTCSCNSCVKNYKLKYFLLGCGSVCAILLLSAFGDSSNTTLSFGRYQLSSWAASLNNGSCAIGAFVMDTASGETKTVYMRTYGDQEKNKLVKNDLKKPFSAIQ